MLISPEYRLQNREMHATKTSYGDSWRQLATHVVDLARILGAVSILDYGCGRGTLKEALPAEFEVFEYDPGIEGKETKPSGADLVVCGDVLEHIEPDCLYSVLDDIRGIARKGVF